MELTPKQQAAVEWVFVSRQDTRRGWWMLPILAIGLICAFAAFWATRGEPDWRFLPFILLALAGFVWARCRGRYGVAHPVVFAAMWVVAWGLEGAERFMDLLFPALLLFFAWYRHRRLVLADVLEAAGVPEPDSRLSPRPTGRVPEGLAYLPGLTAVARRPSDRGDGMDRTLPLSGREDERMELTRKQKAAVEWVFVPRRETRRGWWLLPITAVGLTCIFGISWALTGVPNWQLVPFALVAAVGAVWPRRPGRQGIVYCVLFAAVILVGWILDGAEGTSIPLLVAWCLFGAWLQHRLLVLADVLEAAGIPAPGSDDEPAVESPNA